MRKPAVLALIALFLAAGIQAYIGSASACKTVSGMGQARSLVGRP